MRKNRINFVLAGAAIIAALCLGACSNNEEIGGLVTESSSQEEKMTTMENNETMSQETTTDEALTTEETTEVDDGYWHPTVDISDLDPNKPMVAFAFDDGPVGKVEGNSAMRILEAIHKEDQGATFFYICGSMNVLKKEEIKLAYEYGFEIANHTWSHQDLTKISEEEAMAEIEDNRLALKQITGLEKYLIRAPYLATNQAVLEMGGVPFVNCGIDTRDWTGISADEIIDCIKSADEKGTLENQILLMHETNDTTAEAVEYLVPYLKEKGYQIVSVSEMFAAKGVMMENGTIYNNCPNQ